MGVEGAFDIPPRKGLPSIKTSMLLILKPEIIVNLGLPQPLDEIALLAIEDTTG